MKSMFLHLILWCHLCLFTGLSGCANKKARSEPRTLREYRVQRFISDCTKAQPPWTAKQKTDYLKVVEQRKALVEKSLRSEGMKGARLKAIIWPECIEASCYDALCVFVEGVVVNVGQKR